MEQQRLSHLTFLTPKHIASSEIQNKHGFKVSIFIIGYIRQSGNTQHQSKTMGCSLLSFILLWTCLSRHLFDCVMSWFRKLSWQKNCTKIIPQGGQCCSSTGLDRLAMAIDELYKQFTYFSLLHPTKEDEKLCQTRNKGCKDMWNGCFPTKSQPVTFTKHSAKYFQMGKHSKK